MVPVDVRLNAPNEMLPAVNVRPVAFDTVALLPKVSVAPLLFIVILLNANGAKVAVIFPAIVPEPPIVKGLPPPVIVPLPKLILPFNDNPADNETIPLVSVNVPLVVIAELTVKV